MLMNNEIIISNHDPQDITITQDDNQLIFINGGGEVIGITDVLVNGSSVVTNNVAYVLVPTKTSQLINDSGYINNETDPTVPSYVKAITIADINNWDNKQDLLVSGTNIKTINNTSLLGSGNIDIQGGESYSAGTGIDITSGIISNTITSYNDLTDLPTIPTQTSDLLNDSDFVSEDDLSEVAFTGSYASLSDTPEIPDATSELTNDGDGTYPFLLNKSSQYIDGIGTLGGSTAQARNLAYTWDNGVIQESHTVANYDDLTNELASKQDTLVSGTNIKTINNTSLLGSGDISIGGGTATDVQINGTSIVSSNVANIITESAYNSSSNKIATMSDISSLFDSGTFTPTIKGSTSSGTITYTLQYGRYQKIKNIVFYDFRIGISAISNASGQLIINGIPYLSNIDGNNCNIGNMMSYGDLFSNNIRQLWTVSNNIVVSSANNEIGALNINNTTSNNYLYGTGYFFIS